MTYDLTFLDNTNSSIDLIKGVTNLTNGSLFPVLLITFSVIFIMVTINREDFKNVLLANAFITTILAVLLWASTLAAWYIVIYPVILLSASIMLIKFGGD